MEKPIEVDSVYAGEPRDGPGGRVVTKDGQVLPLGPSQQLWNHSPDGYNWGYGGSGPAQLALALLLDVIGPQDAVNLHQHFKAEVVSQWHGTQPWDCKASQIEDWWIKRVGTGELARRERNRCQAADWIDRLAGRLLNLLEAQPSLGEGPLAGITTGLLRVGDLLRREAEEGFDLGEV